MLFFKHKLNKDKFFLLQITHKFIFLNNYSSLFTDIKYKVNQDFSNLKSHLHLSAEEKTYSCKCVDLYANRVHIRYSHSTIQRKNLCVKILTHVRRLSQLLVSVTNISFKEFRIEETCKHILKRAHIHVKYVESAFSESTDLKVHMQTHAGEKPFFLSSI